MYVFVCMFLTKIKFIIRAARRSLFTRTMIKNRGPFKRKKYFSIRKWDLDLSKDEKRKNKRYSYQRKDWGCYTKPFFCNLCWNFVVPSRREKCQVLYVPPYPNLDACCFSVVGQTFIVQWSNILLHENPQGKSVMLWKKNAKLKRFFFNFMFASFQPVVSPFSVRLIKQVKLSSLITR